MITLTINNESREFPSELSLSELIVCLELTGKRIAIEKNGEIVPRSQHTATRVDDGDQLEIVVAVGGG